MRIIGLTTDLAIYSASAFAAALLPNLFVMANKSERWLVTPDHAIAQNIESLEQSLVADYRLAEGVIEYHRAARDHILKVNETRLEFLANELVTINTNATIALRMAEQAEKLLLLNREHLAACTERLKSIECTRNRLESLKNQLEESLHAEESAHQRRSQSLLSVRTALRDIENRLIPEANREKKRVRQSLKEAFASLYSVTSDKSFSASDIDDARLDELVDNVATGKTSLEQFKKDLRTQFPNGLRREYKKKETRVYDRH